MRTTTEVPNPVRHVLVYRGGRPTVVSYLACGLEVARREFDDWHAAIAHLARLQRW